MEEKEKYENMYERLVSYEKGIHEQNQRRIRIGLKCILVIPLIFLLLLFWTGSNKVVFLILWIVSLFGIADYLISVEYIDYNLQEKLNEICSEDQGTVDALLGQKLDTVGEGIRHMVEKLDDSLNFELEPEETSEKETEVAELEEHR